MLYNVVSGHLPALLDRARDRSEHGFGYLKAAGIDVRGRGGAKPKPATLPEVITDSTDSKPATLPEVITDSVPSRSPSASSCEPYRELVTRWYHDDRTAMSIWQELVEKHGFTARYASVQRFVRGLHDAVSSNTNTSVARPIGSAKICRSTKSK